MKIEFNTKEFVAKAKAQANKAKAHFNNIDINTAKAKKLGKQALDYAKENPSDIMVGIITLMVMDMDDSIDAIEESSSVSAFVDAASYINRRY